LEDLDTYSPTLLLSACIITLNEEVNLGRCLRSLAGVADEVVVMDSFSTDATVAIAERFGARVHSAEWIGYSGQKNMAHELASHPYILSIDADEELSEELRQSILHLKKSGYMLGGYRFRRMLVYEGKVMRYGGLTNEWVLRLFPKEWRWEGSIHEKLVIPERATVARLEGRMLHYSYLDLAAHAHQAVKFGKMNAEARVAKGKSYSFIAGHIKPVFKFMKHYYVKLGILEGSRGFNEALISAFSVWIKVAHTRQLHRLKREQERGRA
jgi:glycosyltransferase involved in cell wall biosynthesis